MESKWYSVIKRHHGQSTYGAYVEDKQSNKLAHIVFTDNAGIHYSCVASFGAALKKQAELMQSEHENSFIVEYESCFCSAYEACYQFFGYHTN